MWYVFWVRRENNGELADIAPGGAIEFDTGWRAFEALQNGDVVPPGPEYRAALMEAESAVEAIRAWAWDAPPKARKR